MDKCRQDYENLVKQIEGRIILCIGRILPEPNDADDALQGALVNIWKSFRKIKKHPNPQALILRISANAAYDVLRKNKRYLQGEDRAVLVENIPDAVPAITDQMVNREIRQEIMRAIACLSRKQAQVVIMRFAQELSYESIAQALDCEQATARKHLQRARLKLKKSLSHLFRIN